MCKCSQDFQDSELLLQIPCVLVCEVAENMTGSVGSGLDSQMDSSGEQEPGNRVRLCFQD